MENSEYSMTTDRVSTDVGAIIATLRQHDETTWSSRIAYTLTGVTVEDVFPLLRHELCELRKTPLPRALGLEQPLAALIATLDDALVPYGFKPEPRGEVKPISTFRSRKGDDRSDSVVA